MSQPLDETTAESVHARRSFQCGFAIGQASNQVCRGLDQLHRDRADFATPWPDAMDSLRKDLSDISLLAREYKICTDPVRRDRVRDALRTKLIAHAACVLLMVGGCDLGTGEEGGGGEARVP